MKIKSILFLIILLFIGNTGYGQDAQEIIKKVQANYNSIKDAKASFSHSGKRTSEAGTIYIQKENKYRIETKGQILITDGVTSWSYSVKKKQVIIDNYKENDNTFSPNKFLFNYPENFYSDLEGTETVSGLECFLLKLTPRNKGNVKSAKIWVDKEEYLIRKISIVSKDGTDTYTLKKINLDSGVSSSKFTFTAPSDVEIIDLR